jgi:hypothetical protein
MTREKFIGIVDRLQPTHAFAVDHEPKPADIRQLAKDLQAAHIDQLITILEETDPTIDINAELLAGNHFSPAIVKAVQNKDYKPHQLADVITKVVNNDLHDTALLHAFHVFEPLQMIAFLHQPDLLHLMNCKYKEGCVTMQHFQQCPSLQEKKNK